MLPVKNLFVLYTGGTIGMLQTPQGLAPAGGFEARMRDHLQSLGDAPDLRWRFAELQPPLDSANMTQGNWLAMRDAIVAALDAGHDGVLLLHGTDTLAYSAAALSFLLLDLPVPVLLTGSMLPAGAPGSDAWDNLVGALRVLQEGHARGVQVYFNDALLHGARVSKLRSDAFDAFAELPRPRHAEHAPVPAALGYRQPRREVNLAVLPLYPGLRAAHLRGLLDSGVEALLLECYGSGTGPSDDGELLALLREAHAAGSQASLDAALASLRKGGELVLVSLMGEVRLDAFDLVNRELRLLGSVGYRDAYPELIALLADGRLDLARAVTRSVPLEQAVEHGFEALLRDKSQVKVLVNPNPALADA